MNVTAEMVKELRRKSSAGVMDCKRALQEAEGDSEKAFSILRRRGMAAAVRKMGRSTREGLIASYIHFGKIGVLVEVNCESDFVARTDDFKDLVKDITMHIAARNPQYIHRDEMPKEMVEEEREALGSQFGDKPAQVVEKIVDGKMDKFFAEICLLDQPFIKDEEMTVKEYITARIAKLGENIQVGRFVRYQLGEEV